MQKKITRNKFKQEGKCSIKFYDHGLILNELLVSWDCHNVPEIDKELIKVIKKFRRRANVIIVSLATRDFVSYELGKYSSCFYGVFSTIDDFNIPGKVIKRYI